VAQEQAAIQAEAERHQTTGVLMNTICPGNDQCNHGGMDRFGRLAYHDVVILGQVNFLKTGNFYTNNSSFHRIKYLII
jgi:hypothetical protein